MAQSRYTKLKFDGKLMSFPKITIKKRDTDIYTTYNPNLNRLDRMAADIYSDDTLYWLILLANPQFYMEFDIPAGAVIRIPNPLNDVMSEFNQKIVDKSKSV